MAVGMKRLKPWKVSANRWMSWELKLHSVVGVAAAGLLAVMANWAVMRAPHRWDVTSNQLYTLSPATSQTLQSLSSPVELIVFLGESDPQMGSVRQLLEHYRAESSQLTILYVDPDRNPAQFVALQNRFRLSEGRSERGHLVSDAALLVVSGSERWVIPPEHIVHFDPETGSVQPLLEQSLTEGLRQVLHPQVTRACFSEGHGEPGIDDGGPRGLAAVRQMFAKNNYSVQRVPLGMTAAPLALSACDLLVVVSPQQPFSTEATARIISAAERGLNVLLAMGPSLNGDNPQKDVGLESLLELFQLRWGQELIFERDPERALPGGMGGEAFLAHPRPHAVTSGMLAGEEVRLSVMLQLAQSVQARPGAERTSSLLQTSERAFGVSRDAIFSSPNVTEPGAVDALKRDSTGPFSVAMVSELARSVGPARPRAGRMLALGSSTPLITSTWNDASLAGDRRFIESAVAWLVSRPALVRLPEKAGRKTALRLTEGSMARVARYVLLYMPLTALLVGALILLRRRSDKAIGASKR